MFRISTIVAGIFLTLLGFTTMAQLPPEGSASGFTSATLIGSTIWTQEPQPGWVPYVGDVLDFAADGTGVSYEKLDTLNE